MYFTTFSSGQILWRRSMRWLVKNELNSTGTVTSYLEVLAYGDRNITGKKKKLQSRQPLFQPNPKPDYNAGYYAPCRDVQSQRSKRGLSHLQKLSKIMLSASRVKEETLDVKSSLYTE